MRIRPIYARSENGYTTLVCTQDPKNTVVEDLDRLQIMRNAKLYPLRLRTYIINIDDIDENERLVRGMGEVRSSWGVTRPNVEEFLKFCFAYFKLVIVWSAGLRSYVDEIVDHLFTDIQMPNIVWSREDMDYVDRELDPTKRLAKLCSKYPEHRAFLNPKKIFFVDDNILTFRENPHNAIHIPEYDPKPELADLMAPDDTLLKIKYWLLQKHVSSCDDVRLLEKTDIFSMPLAVYKKKWRNQVASKTGSNRR
jgi:hypothetical protein